MSTLNPDLLQEGNGIYGWDLINPYLQEWYRKKRKWRERRITRFHSSVTGRKFGCTIPLYS